MIRITAAVAALVLVMLAGIHPAIAAVEVGGAQGGFATYELIFRRDNALVELVYLGPSSYTESTLTSLAATVDSHLQTS